MKSSPRVSRYKIILLAFVASSVTLAAFYFISNPITASQYIEMVIAWVNVLGWWKWFGMGLVIFFACLAIVVPATPLVMLAGAVFGVWWGFVIVVLATFASAIVAFLASRFIARLHIQRLFAGTPVMGELQKLINTQGWKAVFIARLSPLFPFGALSYAFGLTDIRLLHFVLGTTATMPSMLAYIYGGFVAGEIFLVSHGSKEFIRSPYEWAVFAGGLLATIYVVVYLYRFARYARNVEG